MQQAGGQRIAVFDVDGTLLQGDCLWLAARRSKGPTMSLPRFCGQLIRKPAY